MTLGDLSLRNEGTKTIIEKLGFLNPQPLVTVLNTEGSFRFELQKNFDFILQKGLISFFGIWNLNAK